MPILEVNVINAGKYAEGHLMEVALDFPATTEEVQAVLKRIGVDGVRYQEVFITEHDSPISGFCHCFTQYDHIDELNYLSHLIRAFSPDALEKFQAVIEAGEHNGCAGELINLALNLDSYEFFPGVDSEEELGRIYAEDMELLEVPEPLRKYMDYEAYGRDTSINENGSFAGGGYLRPSGDALQERYHGREDIPAEHRVFDFPRLNIRERLAAYREVSARAADQNKKHRADVGREER
ncbi:antirestriction protein ArdA [Pseudoflavonifractor phocaeensis]|uniref:antirestriction protein ArdA n=1 Tax=Pseudoflavonifractor phocaeensis TaxID=1870988 RepID=UPI00210DB7BC|nr:antirestriction protein ArdA [Pseudoflavonifractor phocaeensis]MCQ4862988.1 antirestriction protein ArdA [Pseudoflavonifractor phocaeensis]